MLALIGNLDTTELLVVLFAAILVFGRRLPQVAAQAGQQLGKLRRTLDSAWKESGADSEMRDVQRSIQSIRDAVPRDLSAASIARTAATEFQRRVEANALNEEEAVRRRAEPVATEPTPTEPASAASIAPSIAPMPSPTRSADVAKPADEGSTAPPMPPAPPAPPRIGPGA